jgi:NADH:ubiquinone oxidoreductase subunit E
MIMIMEQKLKAILDTHTKTGRSLITLLQQTQTAFGYLPEEAIVWFSKKLDIPESRFFGIATFYSQFHLKPTGKNTITVCCGAACHIKGADKILHDVRSVLSLSKGEDTTQDLSFTVQNATCIGACSIAPVAILNNQVYGNMDAEQVVKLVKGFEKEGEYTGFEYD